MPGISLASRLTPGHNSCIHATTWSSRVCPCGLRVPERVAVRHDVLRVVPEEVHGVLTARAEEAAADRLVVRSGIGGSRRDSVGLEVLEAPGEERKVLPVRWFHWEGDRQYILFGGVLGAPAERPRFGCLDHDGDERALALLLCREVLVQQVLARAQLHEVTVEEKTAATVGVSVGGHEDAGVVGLPQQRKGLQDRALARRVEAGEERDRGEPDPGVAEGLEVGQ